MPQQDREWVSEAYEPHAFLIAYGEEVLRSFQVADAFLLKSEGEGECPTRCTGSVDLWYPAQKKWLNYNLKPTVSLARSIRYYSPASVTECTGTHGV